MAKLIAKCDARRARVITLIRPLRASGWLRSQSMMVGVAENDWKKGPMPCITMAPTRVSGGSTLSRVQ
jgi:hypothetical protein